VEILNDQARCHLGRDLVISPTAGGHNLNQQLHAALSKICPQHSHGNAMGNAIEKTQNHWVLYEFLISSGAGSSSAAPFGLSGLQ
jgi:hypothetical protein